MTEAAQPPRRRRRTAEEARRAILEAAQRRLAECGPEEIRLQDIAADLGISHPAILHHFGSREVLMRELSRHAFAALNDDLVRALERGSSGGVTAWLDQVFETLRDQGHARLLAWGTLTGRQTADEDEPQLLRDLARAVHARRQAARGPDADGQGPGALEDTVFAVQLVAAALLGDALLGDVLRRSGGLEDDLETRERFRSWLADQVYGLLVPGTSRESGAGDGAREQGED